MKFSTKLLSLYVAIYLIVITVVGITVTENSYQLLRQQEITRAVGRRAKHLFQCFALFIK